MKKLIISALAVAIAATVNAAAVSWALEKDSAKTYGGLKAYVINGSDFTAVTTLLAAGGESVATDFNAYVIDTVELNSRGAGASNTTGVTGDNLAWIIFADNKIANGSKYDTTGLVDISAYAFTPPESAPGDLALTVGSFTTKGAPIGGTSPVPEPTSGMLMLLGMAGLALRRRCA